MCLTFLCPLPLAGEDGAAEVLSPELLCSQRPGRLFVLSSW